MLSTQPLMSSRAFSSLSSSGPKSSWNFNSLSTAPSTFDFASFHCLLRVPDEKSEVRAMFGVYSPRSGLSTDFGKPKRSDFDRVAEPYRVPAEQTSEPWLPAPGWAVFLGAPRRGRRYRGSVSGFSSVPAKSRSLQRTTSDRPRQATSGLGALLKAASDEEIIALDSGGRQEHRRRSPGDCARVTRFLQEAST